MFKYIFVASNLSQSLRFLIFLENGILESLLAAEVIFLIFVVCKVIFLDFKCQKPVQFNNFGRDSKLKKGAYCVFLTAYFFES